MADIIHKQTFTQLQKLSKSDMQGLPVFRLALIGDCSTQHLSAAIRGCAYAAGLNIELFEADYDQIIPQIMDKGSEMYMHKPEAVLIFMCAERLYKRWCDTPTDERGAFAQTEYAKIEQLWSQIAGNCEAKILQYTFAENDDGVFGNFACREVNSYIYQIRKLNMFLMEGAASDKNIFPVDLCGMQAQSGRDNLFDPKLYYLAKMPLAPDVLPAAANRTVSVIQALRGVIKKCVILDLDNTLWGGVIGDDGLSGIQIGELGAGEAFSAFQTWLKELKKRGIILAVCSKNEEKTAKEPFEKLDEMILKLDDFALFTANWDDKAANIRNIRQILNIGFDSMVFIDDNPFERELVKSMIPEITVPDIPEDPAGYIPYLQSLNLFETASFSGEDTRRTEQYQALRESEALKQQFLNYDDYLQSLEMTAVAAPFDAFHTPRIAQLTQRSNQFNLRTVRYTEAEIEEISKNPGKLTLYFTLRDKLADHGLISVVIIDKTDDKTLFIDTWLMSCRVLKRGMEEFIVNKIVETAEQNGFDTITGEYIPTQKNMMVADIYEKMGFNRSGQNKFILKTDEYTQQKTNIGEQQHEQR